MFKWSLCRRIKEGLELVNYYGDVLGVVKIISIEEIFLEGKGWLLESFK